MGASAIAALIYAVAWGVLYCAVVFQPDVWAGHGSPAILLLLFYVGVAFALNAISLLLCATFAIIGLVKVNRELAWPIIWTAAFSLFVNSSLVVLIMIGPPRDIPD
jgi:hypothetical protein